MQYKKYDGAIVARIDRGEEIVEQLREIARCENITAASVSAIGAVSEFVAGAYEMKTKEFCHNEYRGDYEITSLTGNVTQKDGAPYLHLHVACADKTGKTVGGHLTRAVVSVTCEVVILPFAAIVGRKTDAFTGINVLDFDTDGN